MRCWPALLTLLWCACADPVPGRVVAPAVGMIPETRPGPGSPGADDPEVAEFVFWIIGAVDELELMVNRPTDIEGNYHRAGRIPVNSGPQDTTRIVLTYPLGWRGYYDAHAIAYRDGAPIDSTRKPARFYHFRPRHELGGSIYAEAMNP